MLILLRSGEDDADRLQQTSAYDKANYMTVDIRISSDGLRQLSNMDAIWGPVDQRARGMAARGALCE